MALVVTKSAGAAEALGGVGTLEMVPRNCRLENYKKIKEVPTFDVTGELIAYASPDSTYAVTRRLLDGAQSDILIGIYGKEKGSWQRKERGQTPIQIGYDLDLDQGLTLFRCQNSHCGDTIMRRLRTPFVTFCILLRWQLC